MRAAGFNTPQIIRFVSELEELEKCVLAPSRIFSTDETGVSCVHIYSNVPSDGGRKQLGKLTPGEMGHYII
jgi:hypothetical protein